MQSRRTAVRLFVAGLASLLAGGVAAQADFPNRPIRIISPYTPGGGTTTMARLVGQKLGERLGHQVIVENRPGGNSVIGTEAAARSAPDGYTLLVQGSDHVLVPLLLKTSYDPIRDFVPVASIASSELILVVHPALPVNSLRELIAHAKERPGQLNYPTPSAGGVQHLAHELFNQMTGIRTNHVPYKGGAPAVTDLMGGHVQFFLGSSASVMPHVKSGRLKALAVSGKGRLAALPEIPTFTEAGLPNFDVGFWNALLAPAGTPRPVLDKLTAEIARVLALPEVKEQFAAVGAEPFVSTPEQFTERMKEDSARYARIIRDANIKLHN